MLRSLIKIFFLNIKARYWHSDYITYSTSLISKVVVMIKWCKSVCLESSKCCEGFLLIMIMMVMMTMIGGGVDDSEDINNLKHRQDFN